MVKDKHKDGLLWLLYVLMAIVFLGFEYSRKGDFHIYLEASSDFLQFNNIYQNLYGDHKVFPYFGSPTLAFLLAPLTFIPLKIALFFWKFINLLFFIRIWTLIKRYFDLTKFSQKQYTLFQLATFISASFLIYLNFHLSQFTVFLLFTALEGMYQIRTKRNPLFGVSILGLGIITKLLPLVLIPYLIYRGYFKSVLGLMITLTLFIMLPSVYLGWERNTFLFKEWLIFLDPFKGENTFDVSTRSVHGIAALISTLTIEGIGNVFSLPIRRNLVNLAPETVAVIIQVIKASFVLFSLFFLKSKKIFSDHKSDLSSLWELSYILSITPLIFPQQRTYAFLFLLPAIGFLVYGFINNQANRRFWPLFIFSLGVLLLNLELFLGHFRVYYWHYKTFTYGVLIILAMLSWMNPRKASPDPAPD